ncbi:MAG: hypothetical protein DI598_08145, partial [Pseudopedobacter saltans]
MEENQFKRLLKKWTEGNLQPEEVDIFLAYLDNPDAEEVVGLSIIKDLKSRHIRFQLEKLEEEKAELSLSDLIEREETEDNIRPLSSIKKWFAAASIIVLIGCFAWWLRHDTSTKTMVVSNQVDNIVRIVNNSDSTLHYTLPDGSIVSLKKEAEISFEKGFSTGRNILLVKGDAFFKVQKNPNAPFSVFAKGIKTTALGTAFWVENPALDSSVTVRLKEGKVRLVSIEEQFHMKEVFLTPGKDCYINKRTGYVKVNDKNKQTIINDNTITAKKTNKVVESDRAVLWTKDEVTFNGAKLDNVLSQLEARYNVTIVADKSLTQKIILTGQIYTTDSLRSILKSICDMNSLKYE